MTFYICYLEIPENFEPLSPEELNFSENEVICSTFYKAKECIEEEERVAVILNKERNPISWYYGENRWSHIH